MIRRPSLYPIHTHARPDKTVLSVSCLPRRCELAIFAISTLFCCRRKAAHLQIEMDVETCSLLVNSNWCDLGVTKKCRLYTNRCFNVVNFRLEYYTDYSTRTAKSFFSTVYLPPMEDKADRTCSESSLPFLTHPNLHAAWKYTDTVTISCEHMIRFAFSFISLKNCFKKGIMQGTTSGRRHQ